MGSKKKSKAKRKAAGELARRREAEAVQAFGQREAKKEQEQNEVAEVKKEQEQNEAVAKKAQKQNEAEEAVTVTELKEIVTKTSLLQNWNKAKKGTRYLFVLLAAVGVALLVVVVLLLLQVHSLSQRLETVQAMSESLQMELKSAKTAAADSLLLVEKVGKPSATPLPTKEPKPTSTLTPTPVIEKYLVCVDAGHGGRDSGAVYEYADGTERYEKDDNLWMSLKFKEALEAYGVKVVMTRDDDTFLALYERTDFANSMDADALISFHRNAAYYTNNEVNETIKGVEIWIHSSRPAGAEQLAEDMLASIMDVGGMKNRGVKSGSMSNFNEDYAINRRAVMTSMIVEMGFITSPEENDIYSENGEAYATAMAKAVYDWLEAQDNSN